MTKKVVAAPAPVETFEAYRDDAKLSTTLRVLQPQASQNDIDLIHARLKLAQQHYKEHHEHQS